MISVVRILTCAVTGLWLATAAGAQSWTLDSDTSKLAFGSIKKDAVGEVHSFETLTGTVAASGMVEIKIDLASVQTNIDVRNERMVEFLFNNAPTATLMAQIDMDEVAALTVGQTTILDIEGSLSLGTASLDIETEMFVARLSEAQVMVTTNDMIFLNMQDAGINAGISKLMKLAKLSVITRTSPVTLRLIFNADEQKAETPPAAASVQVAAAGDLKNGKKVFRKCKVCHALEEGKNGVGPSLHGVIGSKSGSVEGVKYSKAMARAEIVWTIENLSDFLAKPKKYMPGTRMGFGGLRKDTDVADVLAYIAEKSGS